MAPAAPELLLLGLMHFALARLDIWHWKVLKMLLQNSVILIAAAFLPSTTTDWCSWAGQPLQLGELPGRFQETKTCFLLISLQLGCFFALLTSPHLQVAAPKGLMLSVGTCSSRGGYTGYPSLPGSGGLGPRRQDPCLLRV